MRTGAPRGHVGYYHEAGFYRCDAEFLAQTTAYIEEGIAAGEPVIVACDERKVRLLRSWLSRPSAVDFIVDDTLYATPAKAIENYQQLFERHVAAGAQQIRVTGEVPHAEDGDRFHGWDRYESAINAVWQDYPLWSRCLYDGLTVADEVRDVVERTHPHLVTAAGESTVNSHYQDVAEFRPLPPRDDPIETSAPLVELVDPTPQQARQQLLRTAYGLLADGTVEDLLIGVTETVANAWLYGRPPITVRVWAGPERLVVHVQDTGPGPADPLVGLVPGRNSPPAPGLGLWLVQQLDLDVAFLSTPDGFTVRLRGGRLVEPTSSETARMKRDETGPNQLASIVSVRIECTAHDPPRNTWDAALALTWNRKDPGIVEILVLAAPPHSAGRWHARRELLDEGRRRRATDDGAWVEPGPDGQRVRLHLDAPVAELELPTASLRAFLELTSG